jgi:hypothetical protein
MIFGILFGIAMLWGGCVVVMHELHSHRYQEVYYPPQDTPAPSTPDPGQFVTGPVKFTIFDSLGTGQSQDTAWVYVDDQNPPVGTITINRSQPTAYLTVPVPTAGKHFISVVTETRIGNRVYKGSGRWEANLRGGEQYELGAGGIGETDEYTLTLNPHQ